MNVKRIAAGVAITGGLGLATLVLGAGIAAAEPPPFAPGVPGLPGPGPGPIGPGPLGPGPALFGPGVGLLGPVAPLLGPFLP